MRRFRIPVSEDHHRLTPSVALRAPPPPEGEEEEPEGEEEEPGGKGMEGLDLRRVVTHSELIPRFPRHPFAERRAKELRKSLTDEEALLWYHIRSDVPAKFRRQEPFGRYICDFVYYHPRLIIELDGGGHDDSDHDRIRDAWLRSQGFEVLRFGNYEMMHETEAVLEAISIAVEELCSRNSSSPSGGGAAEGGGGGQTS
jgi:very-short-patch-repair endonuclease